MMSWLRVHRKTRTHKVTDVAQQPRNFRIIWNLPESMTKNRNFILRHILVSPAIPCMARTRNNVFATAIRKNDERGHRTTLSRRYHVTNFRIASTNSCTHGGERARSCPALNVRVLAGTSVALGVHFRRRLPDPLASGDFHVKYARFASYTTLIKKSRIYYCSVYVCRPKSTLHFLCTKLK